ncbi:hypothetical protein LCGC14_1868870 [marine sediment metagenome]|uniref:Uncharacterized protein n=1 Tax=marine sediment metagenome TaxID=412755 RepID=A0A0F9G5N2_9ZZZZ
MSKMGQLLDQRLDEDKYELLDMCKKLNIELRFQIDGMEHCEHIEGMCSARCEKINLEAKADRLIFRIEKL